MEDHPLWKHLATSSLLRYLLLFVCGWAAVALLEYFETVIIIFTAATILAFLLSYPVRWLRRFLPHGVAVSIVFAIALMVIGGLITTIALVVLSQGQPLIDNLSDFLTSLTPRIEALEQFLQRRNLPVDLQSLGAQFRDQAVGLLGVGVNLLQGLVNNFLHSVLIAVVTLFMLFDGARLWYFLIKRLPLDQQRRITETVQDSFLGFFWGRLLLSIFFGVSTFVVFLLLGVPYAPTLAVIAGVFDLIPGIGATLGVSLISLFLLSQSILLATQSIVICVVLQQVEENLLLPRIMKDSLNINPVVMFFALIVGARIAGVLGIFLSIPVASTIINLLEIDEMKGSAAVSSSAAKTKS
ncbi:conserved domain protein, putative [Synechococcus sp. PCC 7335]|uniref:AI-2E family transporter n=1 Tax=Synechococcus sp. (strain ATCC 29403 / PCC 7335) TaxID=91464 RepID=UPI00017ECECE|nr:AI-2E family transporter [Synechococcus sp. PCC 7335]EDX85157.1 conserved domain protein, putative [Synechococcus sp. PCC 7335]